MLFCLQVKKKQYLYAGFSFAPPAIFLKKTPKWRKRKTKRYIIYGDKHYNKHMHWHPYGRKILHWRPYP